MGVINEDQKEVSAKYKVWIPLVFSLATLLGLFMGYKMAGTGTLKNLIVELDNIENGSPGRVEELVRFIESRYVNEVDNEVLITDAFENVLSHLDPHSIYLKPEEMKLLNEQMEGSFEGIGIESILLDDTLHVNHVLKDGPSEKAGLKIGDQMLSINGENIAGMGLELRDIRLMLKGEKLSNVDMQVRDFTSKEIKEIQVQIDDVDVKSSRGYRYNEDLAIISIKRFSSDSYVEFMKCLEDIESKGGFKDLILDLRGNPGGFLPEATKILNQIFKEKGKLLVYTKGRNERVSDFESTGKNFYNIDKVAILIDEGSASGSEIIAGAIQDWDRGLVIGRRSFGKGLVQEQYELSNGGALRLTVAEYFTPSGRLIQKSYEDKLLYQNDIADRIQSGELRGDRSMPVGDTTVYKTKIKKRIVFGGGGISPDIFIPLDSFELKEENIIAQNQTPEFVFRKFKNGELKLEDLEENFLEEWSIDPKMISDFRGYLGYTDADYLWLEPFLAKHLKVEIGKLFFGNQMEMKVKHKDDVFISETVSALSKQNIFAELK